MKVNEETGKMQIVNVLELVISVIFLVFFAIRGDYIMSGIELVAGSFFAFCVVKFNLRKKKCQSILWYGAAFFLVNLLAFASSLIYGNATGFTLYSMTALPAAVYVMYMMLEKKKFVPGVIACNLFTIFVEFGSGALVKRFGVLYERLGLAPLSEEEFELLRGVNIFLNSAVTFLFSLIFIMAIDRVLEALRDSKDAAEYIAMHDQLTGLYNRHYFRYAVDKYKLWESVYCVAIGDIDDFKMVNDTYGHEMGDKVLETVAQTINEYMVNHGFAVRWGGEEILILYKQNYFDSKKQLEELRKMIATKKITFRSESVSVTMTFGIACNDEDGETQALAFSDLLQMADQRMYEGKKAGKNRVIGRY